MSRSVERNRRADARRNYSAILDAAIRLLDAQPDASLDAIATDAGLTRQTVYAHFPSREHLMAAIVDRITDDAVAAMDAAEPDTGAAADALIRVLEAGAQIAARYPVLVQQIAALPVSPDVDVARHAPVAERITRVIQRGQASGEFDRGLPADWLAAITIKIGHAAGEEVDAGRMTHAEAADALRTALLRVLRPGN
ncbi:TetR/AcrR family transcriptional regulator [Micromonospora sp. PSH03]|uniref:TetR/AcrR family transcriptional regulator n=1 Tax=Micromonospora salmantinae TaxID=2911211 RepID=UPI001EE97EB3|nr:TetR/AcrR family transcriptional regulator [Micromonospora salmantinae]MCG5458633.1 TetR/AcrR family transcriptional regulator [Micromonospora salmantinae]